MQPDSPSGPTPHTALAPSYAAHAATLGPTSFEGSKTSRVIGLRPRRLTPQCIHIIVELPSGKRCVHWVSEISLTVSRLSSTSFLTLLRLSSLPC